MPGAWLNQAVLGGAMQQHRPLREGADKAGTILKSDP
jgi:hypothetical protein